MRWHHLLTYQNFKVLAEVHLHIYRCVTDRKIQPPQNILKYNKFFDKSGQFRITGKRLIASKFINRGDKLNV